MQLLLWIQNTYIKSVFILQEWGELKIAKLPKNGVEKNRQQKF